MSRFTDLLQGLGVIRSERQRVERRLAEARDELQALRKAPMCRADALAALENYIDSCVQRFDENLIGVLDRFNRGGVQSFNDIGGGIPLLRDLSNGQHDDRLAVAVVAPLLKQAVRESMKKYQCPGSPPLAKRRTRIAELETEIAGLARELAEIEAAADQARGAL